MIPVNEPLVGQKELEYVSECVRTGWVSSEGRFIREFEERWAAYCGKRFGVAVSNGTVALEIAIGCLDLEPGDEVIMPAFTIISCAQAVTRYGGIPVLVDSDPETWCMDVSAIESKITPRTRAIMPVHIYGHPVDMDPVLALATKYNLAVVEDAAEAHGAEYKGRKCGGLGEISCFSFYANKIITTGEGGMLLTDSEAHASRARSLRNLCFRSDRRFYHTELGNNYRLTNMQAAMGVAQLESIDRRLAHKRWMGRTYTDRLKRGTTVREEGSDSSDPRRSALHNDCANGRYDTARSIDDQSTNCQADSARHLTTGPRAKIMVPYSYGAPGAQTTTMRVADSPG